MTTPRPLRHVRILASAGSGKTYQLATRYLALALDGAPVETILASTFTRAAAGEIRDRILGRLAEAARDEDARRALAAAVGRAHLDRAPVMDVLRSMTSRLHRLQIRTLDSFFAVLVRCFALELDVPVGAQIIDEDETGRLRWEAIRAMLDAGGADHFIDLLRRLAQGVSGRAVVGALERDIDKLLDVAREAAPGAWDWMQRRRELGDEARAAALQRLRDAPAGGGLAKAHREDCDRAARGHWDAFIEKGIAGAIARGQDSYSRQLLDRALIDAYEPLVGHARACVWNAVRDQTSATGQLLGRFDEHLAVIQRRRRVLTFSDLTAAVARGYGGAGFDDLCYRIDARIHHVLLDEFQDTSVAQWRALSPIIREIVSDGSGARTFFCVGDVKQSIYGWRDACPEIFDEVPALLRAPDGTSAVEDLPLAKSWRSSPVIIDVVNDVFSALPTNAALAEYGEAARRFAAGFRRHETVLATLPGYAELRTVESVKSQDARLVTRLRAAARIVRDLAERAPHATIAVLTRGNLAVSRQLYELKRLDVEAAGRGGGPLTDATPVNAVLDLVEMADHPDDTIAAFHVAGGPLGPVAGLSDFADRRVRRDVSRAVRERLMHEGYAATIADWAARLAPSCGPREHRRLLELIELGAEFDGRDEPRPAAFPRFVEQRRVADVDPARVNVMVVHQAKGMEFDAVVLPELDVKLNDEGAVVYEREAGAGPAGPVTRLCRWVSSGQRAALAELESMFDAHRTRAVRESLCLLYVAMTRARQALYMLIDPSSRSGDVRKSLAGVVGCALGEGKLAPDALLMQRGDEAWYASAGGEAPPPPPAPAPPALKLAPSRGAVRGGRAAAASQLGHVGSVLRAVMPLPDRAAIDAGLAQHALFERVTWREDFALTPTEMEGIVRRTVPRRARAWREAMVREFLESLDRPQIRARLSRPVLGEAPEVLTEHSFARLHGGAVQQGSIDRLVVHRDGEGNVRRAGVIDYKTDAVSAAEAPRRAEAYRPQLEVYRAVAAAMFDLHPDAVDATVIFLRPAVVVDLAAAASLFG